MMIRQKFHKKMKKKLKSNFYNDQIYKSKEYKYISNVNASDLRMFLQLNDPNDCKDKEMMKILIDGKFIRDDEKMHITFVRIKLNFIHIQSKQGLIKLNQDMIFDENFDKFYDKDDYQFSYKKNVSVILN